MYIFLGSLWYHFVFKFTGICFRLWPSPLGLPSFTLFLSSQNRRLGQQNDPQPNPTAQNIQRQSLYHTSTYLPRKYETIYEQWLWFKNALPLQNPSSLSEDDTLLVAHFWSEPHPWRVSWCDKDPNDLAVTKRRQLVNTLIVVWTMTPSYLIYTNTSRKILANSNGTKPWLNRNTTLVWPWPWLVIRAATTIPRARSCPCARPTKPRLVGLYGASTYAIIRPSRGNQGRSA